MKREGMFKQCDKLSAESDMSEALRTYELRHGVSVERLVVMHDEDGWPAIIIQRERPREAA